jgi:hypothetical protein
MFAAFTGSQPMSSKFQIAKAQVSGRELYTASSEIPHGYCPNHSTGVRLPEGFAATPLLYVD